MSQESKYYTPTIEEFYVGFEYEIFEKWKPADPNVMYFMPHNDKDQYFKFTFPDPFYGYNLDKLFNQKEIRIKYLDQEDIESLGFILKGKSIDLWFERERIYLRDDGYHLKNIKLQYGKHDQRLKITFHYTSGEEQIHFEGTINNKSELKKLLKQLSIE